MQKSVELDLVQIEDRDNQLKKLEHDINDVNLIFKDLALMVHDQGTFIDSIEANIVRVEVDVRQATTNLQNALDNQVINQYSQANLNLIDCLNLKFLFFVYREKLELRKLLYFQSCHLYY